MEELLKGVKFESIPPEHQANLLKLLEKINIVREKYGKPMTVTSGYRSKEDQIRIYKAKGIPESKIPWGSQHLCGAAIDIADSSGEFYKWCKNNEKLLIEVGVWLETRQGNWQHLQIYPFKSYKVGGTIWFNP